MPDRTSLFGKSVKRRGSGLTGFKRTPIDMDSLFQPGYQQFPEQEEEKIGLSQFQPRLNEEFPMRHNYDTLRGEPSQTGDAIKSFRLSESSLTDDNEAPTTNASVSSSLARSGYAPRTGAVQGGATQPRPTPSIIPRPQIPERGIADDIGQAIGISGAALPLLDAADVVDAGEVSPWLGAAGGLLEIYKSLENENEPEAQRAIRLAKGGLKTAQNTEKLLPKTPGGALLGTGSQANDIAKALSASGFDVTPEYVQTLLSSGQLYPISSAPLFSGAEMGSGAEALLSGGSLGTGATESLAAGGGFGQYAPYIGAALNVLQTAFNDNLSDTDKALHSAADVVGAAAAPYTFGASMIGAQQFKQDLGTLQEKGFTGGEKLGKIAVGHSIPLIGGPLFADKLFKPKIPHNVREAMQLSSELAPAAGGFVENVRNANSLGDLYGALQYYNTGYAGGKSPVAVNTAFNESTAGPGYNYLGLYNPPGGTPLTQDQFFQNLETRPDDLVVGMQAGVTPSKLEAFNNPMRQSILSQYALIQSLNPILTTMAQNGTPSTIVDLVKAAEKTGTDDTDLWMTEAAKLTAQRELDKENARLEALYPESAWKNPPAYDPGFGVG